MQVYNLVVGVDQQYFDTWATPLFKSINTHNPNLRLHCHIVNPTKSNTLSNVDITEETIKFANDTSKISYLQSVRFLIADSKFNKSEKVVAIDADTICTRSYSQAEIEFLFSKQHILQSYKDNRWLAGLVAFSDNGFRQDYINEIKSKDIEEWEWGRDQNILDKFSEEYNFIPAPRDWMCIGKNSSDSIFLTLKGTQKTKAKYLRWYGKYL